MADKRRLPGAAWIRVRRNRRRDARAGLVLAHGRTHRRRRVRQPRCRHRPLWRRLRTERGREGRERGLLRRDVGFLGYGHVFRPRDFRHLHDRGLAAPGVGRAEPDGGPEAGPVPPAREGRHPRLQGLRRGRPLPRGVDPRGPRGRSVATRRRNRRRRRDPRIPQRSRGRRRLRAVAACRFRRIAAPRRVRRLRLLRGPSRRSGALRGRAHGGADRSALRGRRHLPAGCAATPARRT
jgi:hypothetical protein